MWWRLIVADRGFGRGGLIEQCQKLGLDYLVRICNDELSAFATGRAMFGRLQLAHRTIMRILLHALLPTEPNKKWDESVASTVEIGPKGC